MKNTSLGRRVVHSFHSSPFGSIYRYRQELANVRRWTPHDAARLAFYSRFISAGEIVFDVGANLGNRTKIFERLQANVIAIEPQPKLAKALRAWYGGKTLVKVVEAAVGSKVGSARMHIGSAHVLSSLSPRWIDTVTESGRFAGMTWNQLIEVPMTTLELLIREYGKPAFIKIDVEGFEEEVIHGLETCVNMLSFEFTPEMSGIAYSCIGHLDYLGLCEFNFVEGESDTFSSRVWFPKQQIRELLQQYETSNRLFGDIYARHATLATDTDTGDRRHETDAGQREELHRFDRRCEADGER